MIIREAPVAKDKRDDVSVKISARVYRRAKIIAAAREIPLAQYLSEALEPVVNRDWRKVQKEMEAEGEADE